MRTADGAAVRELDDAIPADRHPVGDHELDNLLAARQPSLAQPHPFGPQARVVGIEQIAEQVQPDPSLFADVHARELGTGDQGEASWQGGCCARPPAGGVVVGDREYIEAFSGRRRNQLGRRIGAVGRRGMAMQIDAHPIRV
jgi:hypothetical protein